MLNAFNNGRLPDIMADYWKTFWAESNKSTTSKHPQCQVLRTFNKKPISEAQFQKILEDIEKKMEICRNDEVLDLCCGNGLITVYLTSKCKRAVGVDFEPGLIEYIDLEKYPNVSVVTEDVRKVDFKEHSFDKIMIYAGLQYLSHQETICLFESVFRWLKSNGLFYIGDIPDRERLWNFFNTEERERACFGSIKNDKPIIGTWFDSEWLVKLGKYADFKCTEIIPQPEDFPYSHFRFDAVLKKT